MKRVKFLLIVPLILTFSACSFTETKREAEKPIEDAGNYVPNMMDINKKAQEDIKNATNKENEKLNNILNENNMAQNQNGPGDNSELVKKYSFAVIKTNFGDIKVKFFADTAPVTVGNFLKLASDKFYDGVKFHRVIKGFMIQGGDPLTKDTAMKDSWGTGGPGYKFADELKGTEKYPQGTLAMANSGPNTNGSQFFIVTASPAAPLPANYTVFGQVVEGLDVALKIENVKTTGSPIDRPLEDVVINSVEILEK